MFRGKGPGSTPNTTHALPTVTYDPAESKILYCGWRVHTQLMIHLIEIRKVILDFEDIIGTLKKMTKEYCCFIYKLTISC
jgi:hypothetical protein